MSSHKNYIYNEFEAPIHHNESFNTPILFLVFNRLDTTKKVFEAIQNIKPKNLYIASDGPRKGLIGENIKVDAVRIYIKNNIDWDCNVNFLYREENLGCKIAVSEAISWFFKNEESGIILEDDCLPSQSFFIYCQDLLEKYRNNDDIYMISGDGSATEKIQIKGDYAFIKYPIIWGWASWSRVWKKYDKDVKDWPENKDSLIKNISNNNRTKLFWKDIFEKMYLKQIDTWDYQFAYLVLKNSAKCIVPKKNLISNIGFGEGATHTIDKKNSNANRRRYEINFPLIEAISSHETEKLNSFYDKNEFIKKSIFSRVINKVLNKIK